MYIQSTEPTMTFRGLPFNTPNGASTSIHSYRRQLRHRSREAELHRRRVERHNWNMNNRQQQRPTPREREGPSSVADMMEEQRQQLALLGIQWAEEQAEETRHAARRVERRAQHVAEIRALMMARRRQQDQNRQQQQQQQPVHVEQLRLPAHAQTVIVERDTFTFHTIQHDEQVEDVVGTERGVTARLGELCLDAGSEAEAGGSGSGSASNPGLGPAESSRQ